MGENDIESVLQRLDRLTLEESKLTVAQTLDVVHGLVNRMEVVMEGADHILVWLCTRCKTNMVDGKASTDDIRQTLGESTWRMQITIICDLVR